MKLDDLLREPRNILRRLLEASQELGRVTSLIDQDSVQLLVAEHRNR